MEVINITCSANLFLKKLGIVLLRPNSLQFNALNNAQNANRENITVGYCSLVAPNMLNKS